MVAQNDTPPWAHEKCLATLRRPPEMPQARLPRILPQQLHRSAACRQAPTPVRCLNEQVSDWRSISGLAKPANVRSLAAAVFIRRAWAR